MVAVAEASARKEPPPPPPSHPISDGGVGGLSRASSKRSLRSELIAADTLQTRVTEEDCPVCQLMLPQRIGGGGGLGQRFGCVCIEFL